MQELFLKFGLFSKKSKTVQLNDLHNRIVILKGQNSNEVLTAVFMDKKGNTCIHPLPMEKSVSIEIGHLQYRSVFIVRNKIGLSKAITLKLQTELRIVKA